MIKIIATFPDDLDIDQKKEKVDKMNFVTSNRFNIHQNGPNIFIVEFSDEETDRGFVITGMALGGVLFGDKGDKI